MSKELERRYMLGRAMARDVSRIVEDSNQSRAFMVRKSGVSYSTLKRWRENPPKAGHISTARILLRTLGYDFMIVKKNSQD